MCDYLRIWVEKMLIVHIAGDKQLKKIHIQVIKNLTF